MRKFLLLLSVIALCAVTGCNSKKGSISENDGATLKAELERIGIDNNDSVFAEFFSAIFNSRLYENDKFLTKYCTDKLLKKLVDTYEYEGKGYATWLFRNGYQDGPSNDYKLTKIVPEGNGWYKYDYIDMGNTGSHRIKVLYHVNKRDQIEYYLDDLE
ncbi:MAG: hypothetical protein ILA03_01595 [Bacteroidaceae bacterium]|nr:hypothetical protein [Bacteroidaceae bacterium]